MTIFSYSVNCRLGPYVLILDYLLTNFCIIWFLQSSFYILRVMKIKSASLCLVTVDDTCSIHAHSAIIATVCLGS